MSKSWLSDDGDVNESNTTSITINKRFAKKYENEKRQLEIKELEKKKKRYDSYTGISGSDESSSESEDEAADLLTPAVEAGIFRTLQMIKERDPTIYDKNKSWYDDNTNNKNTTNNKGNKRKDKVMTYKDYMRKRIENATERGYASEGDDENNDADKDKEFETKTYNQEQEDLRQAFIKQAADSHNTSGSNKSRSGNDGGNEDDFLSLVKKTDVDKAKEAAEMEAWRKKHQTDLLPEAERGALQRYYAESKDLDDNDKFLRDYILNRRWDDASSGGVGQRARIENHHANVNDDDDEEEVEKAEEFEKIYNFRFEQAGSNEIVSHSRNVSGTMRRVDNKRKKKRDEKKERKRLEKEKKREELKRLKNLKRKELERRLVNIEKEVGLEGKIVTNIDMKLLEEDFDPDEFDRKMNEMYNDDFYDDETYNPEATEEKNFVHKISLDEDAKDADIKDDGEFKTNIVERHVVNDDDDNINYQEKIKNMNQKKKKAVLDHSETLNDLDYEDIIAGMPTRFRYHIVEKDAYGLSTEEILTADDKLLGQFVPLKKIAPYRDLKWMASGKARKKFRVSYREDLSKAKNSNGSEETVTTNKRNLHVHSVGSKKGRKKRKKHKDNISDARLDSYGL
jgi:protein KRI1